jgi:hypothetical protein
LFVDSCQFREYPFHFPDQLSIVVELVSAAGGSWHDQSVRFYLRCHAANVGDESNGLAGDQRRAAGAELQFSQRTIG